MRKKIAIIGAGNVGSTTAEMCAQRELGDIVLLDLEEKYSAIQGKSLDILQSCALNGSDSTIKPSFQYEDITGADLVIITSGLPRQPGMSRDDLLMTNITIMRGVAENVAKFAPDAFVIVVANPLDAMTYEFRRVSTFQHKKVVGMAGMLDSARLRCFLSMALNCSTKDVNAMVLGGHGDSMVPVLSYCTVNGIPVSQLLEDDVIQDIVTRTRFGGGEIVKLMGTSGYYAAARSIIQMAVSYLKNQSRVMPCCAFLHGEYGLTELCMGVPVIINDSGVEKILEIELNESERENLQKSAHHVRSLIAQLKTF